MSTSSIAFLFPGQGSQKVGMLAETAKHYPIIQAIFSEASQVLGFDLWDLVQNGSEETLGKTENTQPALLTTSVALWRIWREKHNTLPTLLAGHSLGEYSALVCADALAFTDAVKLVKIRGQLMQEAVPEGQGGMAAIIGLSNDEVLALCEQVNQKYPVKQVAPANFNSIGQVVISGYLPAVNQVIEIAKVAGAKLVKLLPVSVPSHSPLMENAGLIFADHLKNTEFCTPTIPVINNVDVKIEDNSESIRNALQRQLSQPVRWVETVEFIINQGIHEAMECGPGKVLIGLNKRINKDFLTHDIETQLIGV